MVAYKASLYGELLQGLKSSMSLIRQAIPADAAAIARVHVASWQSTYAGILPGDFLANLSVPERQLMWRGALADETGGRFVWVAEESQGKIIGFAAAGPERSGKYACDGELYALYLLQEYQGRGIGRELVRAVADRLQEAGMASMLVWVLAQNPACGFYKALGGRREYVQEIEIGGEVYQEVGYGWSDLTGLL